MKLLALRAYIKHILPVISAFCLFVPPGRTACARADAPATSIHRVLLTDGVRLLLQEEPETEGVVVTVFVRQEAPTNGQDAAIQSMVNAALFYGSETRSYEDISVSVNRTGGVLLTRQTPAYLAVTCVTSNEQVREAIYLISEAIKNADFAPDALERARQTLLRQRTERESDPFLAVYDQLTSTIESRIEPNAIDLRHVTQNQARAYFHSHFVPDRTVAVVVGRFDSALVEKSFDNNLFDYDRPSPPLKTPHPVDPDHNFPDLPITSTASGSASYALIATRAPAVTHPDYPAFAVLTTLLGAGHASRMFQAIREKGGLGYDVGATFHAEEDDPLVAYLDWEDAGSSDLHALSSEQALKRISDQLDGLAAHPPTEEELQRARNFTIGQYLIRHERLQERAFLPGWYEVMGLGFDFDTELPKRIAAVTREDIARVVKTYLSQRLTALSKPPTTQIQH